MTITAPRRRVAAGIPTGGQFATSTRDEAALGLPGLDPADRTGCAQDNPAHFGGCACVGLPTGAAALDPTWVPDQRQLDDALGQAYESRYWARSTLTSKVSTPLQPLALQVGDRIFAEDQALRVVSVPKFRTDGDVEFDVISEFDRHGERPSTLAYDSNQQVMARWLAPDVHQSMRGRAVTKAGWLNDGDSIVDDEGVRRTVTSNREVETAVGTRNRIEAVDEHGHVRSFDSDPFVGVPTGH